MSNNLNVDLASEGHINLVKASFMSLMETDTEYFNSQFNNVLYQGATRFTIDISRMEGFTFQDAIYLRDSILNRPMDSTIQTLEEAFLAKLKAINAKAAVSLPIPPRASIDGNFAALHVTPRGLNAHMLAKTIKVRGLVTNVTIPRSRVISTTLYSESGEPVRIATCRDVLTSTSVLESDDSLGMPTFHSIDGRDNLIHAEFGLSVFQDFQKITIQEAPSSCPPGVIPRQLEVIILDDLVDTIKPGDTADFVGIYRIKTSAAAARHTDIFQTYLLANSIKTVNIDDSIFDIEPHVEEYIKHIVHTIVSSDLHQTEQSPILNTLAASVAPSIWGHSNIKQAVVLALAGGVAKKLDTGTRLRGDINILMVGDPGVAKSQLLRFVGKLSPYAVMTTGRGTTGVGLTAAVLNDKDTGERRLEAGAMVLADKGVMLIDELDKMSEEDRVALHEVMEQQVVTISKASIHAELNARCTVIAAANPLVGSYDIKMSPAKNINLPDTLLSRFDLLFVLLDKKDSFLDSEIARHVLTTHTKNVDVQDPASSQGYSSFVNSGLINISVGTKIIDENDDIIRVGDNVISVYTHTIDGQKVFSSSFLKFFITYCRSSIKPVLTAEANALINEYYVSLRAKSKERDSMTTLITPRCLEALIRLSTAHAKIRLSEQVEEYDVKIAYGLLEGALLADFKGPDSRAKKQNRKDDKVSSARSLISRMSLNNIIESNAPQSSDIGSPMAASPFPTNSQVDQESAKRTPGMTPGMTPGLTPGAYTPFDNASTPYYSEREVSETPMDQPTVNYDAESDTVEEIIETDSHEVYLQLKDAIGQYSVLNSSQEVPMEEFVSFCQDSLGYRSLTSHAITELSQNEAQDIVTIENDILYFIF